MLQDFLRDVFTFLRNGRRALGGLQVFRVPGVWRKLKFINLFSIFSERPDDAGYSGLYGTNLKHSQTIGCYKVFPCPGGKEKTEIYQCVVYLFARIGDE